MVAYLNRPFHKGDPLTPARLSTRRGTKALLSAVGVNHSEVGGVRVPCLTVRGSPTRGPNQRNQRNDNPIYQRIGHKYPD